MTLDFILIMWLLIANSPTFVWFRVSSLILRFLYDVAEVVVPLVMCVQLKR